MGYVPTFVALFGLVLLYTVYTYNLIKPRKALLTRVIDKMSENSRNRKALILAHENSKDASSLSDVATMLKKTSTDRFQSYRKEEELMEAVEECAKGLSDAKLQTQLMEMNAAQKALIIKLKSTSNDYNTMIQKPPAKMVASVFGFRPF